MAPFHSPLFPHCLALASEAGLRIGTVDDIQRLQVTTVPLGMFVFGLFFCWFVYIVYTITVCVRICMGRSTTSSACRSPPCPSVGHEQMIGVFFFFFWGVSLFVYIVD